jgi:hypothetical protein
MFLSVFSFSPVNKKIEQNKQELEGIITSLVSKDDYGKTNIKRLNNKVDELTIDNTGEMHSIIEDSDMDNTYLMNSILTNMFEVNTNSADLKIGESLISILDFESFDFLMNETTDDGIVLNKKMLHLVKAANNSVSFTGININPTTCKWVNEKFINFADKMVNHYSGIIGIAYAALRLGAPAFVAQCTATIASIISQFTDWLAAIGPWGMVIKLVLVVFAAIAAVIIAHIIWAGANHKGFKMGLEWSGWFKAKWVYSFYD